MNRGTKLDNVSKLNTYVLMSESNYFLRVYLEKILNKKCKSLKYIDDFSIEAVNLLYLGIQYNNFDNIKIEDYTKIDKRRIKGFINVYGSEYFKQFNIKNDIELINFLINSIKNYNYVILTTGKVKFDNELCVDTSWYIDILEYLVIYLNTLKYTSLDMKNYIFRVVELSEDLSDIKTIGKDTKIYEYVISRNDRKKLTYDNLEYIYSSIVDIEEFNFNKAKKLTSELNKNSYTLNINKKNITLSRENKMMLEKYINENSIDELKEYLKENFKGINSRIVVNKNKVFLMYDILKNSGILYEDKINLENARRELCIDEYKDTILNYFVLAEFYATYVYDYNNMDKYFHYDELNLNDLKPLVIDYETDEYKNILFELSALNRKVVVVNRNINKCLSKGKNDIETQDRLDKASKELETLVFRINLLRNKLNIEKDSNHNKANINKTKIKYIIEATQKGRYTLDKDKLTFECYSNKDGHKTFNLEITIDEFVYVLLSLNNTNLKIDFYRM